ncbi:MAG: hypothetical protein ACK56F_13010, partial [bacterium]
WPLSGVYSIMTVNSAQPGDGRAARLPLSLYLPSRAKLLCTLQLRGHRHSSHFFSTSICTLRCLPAPSSNLQTAEEV